MFDTHASADATVSPVLDAVERLLSAGADGGDASLVDRIAALEQVKRAASAAQAALTARLVASQRAAQVAAGAATRNAHRGVAGQVAFARGESPHRGDRFVGLANALVHEMPHTLDALRTGRISEWGATCLVRETAVLQVAERTEVDARMAEMLASPGVSEAQLSRAARGLAQELDAQSVVARAAKAEADRRVSIRPAPDTMVYVTALLPVAEGVSTYAALSRTAGAAAAVGDPRSRGQVMADTFVARVTGREPATEPVAVHVDLVMTDATLLGTAGSSGTVRAPRQAPVVVPAQVARSLVAAAGSAGRAWLRRLYASPDVSELVAMDSRARRFPRGLARLVTLVDQTCRTPWCDAPIRDTDHATSHARGGSTSLDNAQGLCQRCNLAKEARGWSTVRDPDGTVRTTTPTGHEYSSVPPPVLGWPPTRAPHDAAVVDLHFAEARWHRRSG